MATSAYKVSLVRPGFETLWRDLFCEGSPSDEARKAEKEGAFNVDVVEANNLEEAIRKAKKAHPGWDVVRDGTGRIG